MKICMGNVSGKIVASAAASVLAFAASTIPVGSAAATSIDLAEIEKWAAVQDEKIAAELKTVNLKDSVKLQGTVSKAGWVMPSVQITLKADSGRSWVIWVGKPSSLLKVGLGRRTFQPGMKLALDAFVAKNGDARAIGAKIYFPDGTSKLTEFGEEMQAASGGQ